MRFFTAIVVLAASTMGFAAAIPADPANPATTPTKGSADDVANAFNTLNSQCQSILPGLTGCNDDTCTTNVLSQVITAINACDDSLKGLPDNLVITDGASKAIAGVTDTISTALDAHLKACTGCSNLPSIYANVDSALAVCIATCTHLFINFVGSIASALAGYVIALTYIGFTNLLKAFGH